MSGDLCRFVGFNLGVDLPDVLEVFDCCFSEEHTIRVDKPGDLPDQLPHGLKWSDLNMAIYPGAPTTPVVKMPGGKERFTKDDTWFYLRAFFEGGTPEVIWLHVWPSRIEASNKMKAMHNDKHR